jgi:D-3-phosphoglycerate dehydrogenase
VVGLTVRIPSPTIHIVVKRPRLGDGYSVVAASDDHTTPGPHVTKPVVLIAEELSPATIDALGPDFEIRDVDGADRSALLPALADVDAVLIRSATKMDAEAIAAAPKLKVIARAGVGLDNVDVPAATKAGVMVVNAPTSNITSAAELAVGLLLASARNIAPANQALKSGAWKRSKYGGVELLDKTVGVVGFGRIGQLVADRLRGFGVELLAYDPYVSAQKAAHHGARLVSLDELLSSSDFITIHLPKNAETLGLIGKEALTKVKSNVHIVNAARGGIVDEEALYSALKEGRVAGAGLDVYAKEPCTDSPLFELDQVVCTPHLGASTDEAQEKAGISVATSVRLALAGELVPDAVNVQGGVIAEDVKPGLPLAEKLGRIFTALAGEVAVRLDVEVYGEITQHDVKVLELSALKGVFADVVEGSVSYVNAPLLAQERGLVHDPAAGGVDDADRRLHLVQGLVSDETEGLRGLGQVHGDEVGDFQQLVERQHLDAHLRGTRGLHVGVVRDDLHPEGGHALGDQDADAAEADDTEGLLAELDARVLVPLPLAVLQRGVGLRDVAGGGDEQAAGELGGGDDVGGRGVDDHHAGLGGGGDVDVVQAHTGAGDDLQLLGRGDGLGVHLGGGADEDGVDVGDRGQQLRPVGAVDVPDLEVRAERVHRGGRQLFGDEYDRFRAHVGPHKSSADGRPDGRRRWRG